MKPIITFFFSLMSVIWSSAAFSATIKIASDEWCPYICDNPAEPGYIVELTKTAYESAGFKVEMQYMPLSRAINLAAKGQVDAILGLGAEHILLYQLQSNSVEIGEYSFDYFVRENYPWRYQGNPSLNQLMQKRGRLGLIKDYLYSDYVERLETGYPQQVFRIHGDHPLRTLIAMANKKRVDVIIDSYNTVNYLTKTYKQKPLKFVGTEGKRYGLFIGFSPSFSFQTITELDAALDKQLNSQMLSPLLKRYHVRDWRQSAKNASQ